MKMIKIIYLIRNLKFKMSFKKKISIHNNKVKKISWI